MSGRPDSTTLAGSFCVLLGLLVLLGWWLDVAALRSFVPGLAGMKPNTAVAFMLAGTALALLARQPAGPWTTWARGAAALVGLLGGLTLLQYAFDIDLGIDRLLFADATAAEATALPARMSPVTALNFVLVSAALLRVRHDIADWLAVTAASLGVVAVAGYIYGSFTPTPGPYSAFALHTAAGFTILAGGVIAMRPARGLRRLFLAATPGGALARRIVPAILLVPVVTAWVVLAADRSGDWGGEVTVGVMAFTNIMALVAVAYLTARDLENVESKRSAAEQQLRASEARYRELFDAAPVGLFRAAPDGAIQDVNAMLVRLLGYENRDDLMRQRAFDLGGDGQLRELWRSEFERGTWLPGTDSCVRRADGSLIWSDLHARAVRNAHDGRILYYEASLVDVSERKRAQDALQASESRYRAVVEASIQGVLIHIDGIIQFANRAATSLVGAQPGGLVGMPVTGLAAPAEHYRLAPFLCNPAGGEATRDEIRAIRRDGTPIWCDCVASPVVWEGRPACMMTLVDITDRKRLEQQFLQAQRLDAIGRLAGGVAHDFNNLLTAINASATFVREGLAADHPLRSDAGEILATSQRAADLTRQLLAFSRQQVLAPRVVDVNAVVFGMDRMLRRIIGEDIRLDTVLAPDLGAVRADAGQLERVIVNLAVNARDAMPGGGRLSIRTANLTIDADAAQTRPDVRGGEYVRLTVGDTGSGVAPENLAHLFEPFFSTKPRDQGTGLGLATVYGIVRQSGGSVSVESEPGRGATFHIDLPRVVRSSAADEPDGAALAIHHRDPVAAAHNAPAVLLSSETVLLAEDNEFVRSVARRVLIRLGHHVLEAEDAESALRLAAEHDGDLHLVITDLELPGLSGHQLVEQLRALRTGFAVLFISGYVQDDVLPDGDDHGTAFLQKPFTPAALGHKIREMLGRAESTSA